MYKFCVSFFYDVKVKRGGLNKTKVFSKIMNGPHAYKAILPISRQAVPNRPPFLQRFLLQNSYTTKTDIIF